MKSSERLQRGHPKGFGRTVGRIGSFEGCGVGIRNSGPRSRFLAVEEMLSGERVLR